MYAVAAANDAADACGDSPGSASGTITTGATDSNDAFAYFSDYGPCVAINAPGVNVPSDYYLSDNSEATFSGTSMASPHVAGAAALYLSGHTSATPAEVRSALTNNATAGQITGIPGGTPNLLLYTSFIIGPPPMTLSITGPTLITSQKWCTWTANVTGGIPPYTYYWSVRNNQNLSPQNGTSQSFFSFTGYDNTYRTFTIDVTVFGVSGPGKGSAIFVTSTGNSNYDHTYCS